MVQCDTVSTVKPSMRAHNGVRVQLCTNRCAVSRLDGGAGDANDAHDRKRKEEKKKEKDTEGERRK